MKAKKYEEILKKVLKSHYEVSKSMEYDIMIAFKQNVIIEKYKIEYNQTGCTPLSELNNRESICVKIKECINRKNK